ncbi:MAG: hypothetical protein QOF76_5372 [Solirubrobacteraceae bacterium]|nr:hypothetical protein [Solirubrobacteraceae bacterium]
MLLGLLLLPAAAHAAWLEPVPVAASGADPFGYPADVGFTRSGDTLVTAVSGGSVLHFTRPAGGAFGGGQIGSGSRASMAVAPNGAAVIAFRTSASLLTVAYRTPDGVVTPSTKTYGGTSIGSVAAGIDDNGNAVVAWLDGGIHYALSSAGTFADAQDAPLGAAPSFDGRGSDQQRDRGPRAYRDNDGNVALVYRDASSAVLATRDTSGTWTRVVLPSGTTTNDIVSAADAASHHLIVGYTTTNTFRAFVGTTSSTTGTVPVESPVASGGVSDVAVRHGGTEDLAVWQDAGSVLQGASCMEGYVVNQISPAVANGVLAAVTSGLDELAVADASPGLQRLARSPGGAWVATPFTVGNYGTFTTFGTGYDGSALFGFVDFPSDTGLTGFGYTGPATGTPPVTSTCVGTPTPTPTPVPTQTATPTPTPTATAATGPPTSGTLRVTKVSSTSLKFTATVNPRGLATTVHFDYSNTDGTDLSTPDQALVADTSDHTVTATVSDLSPNSKYTVRTVAVNSAGQTTSAEQTGLTPGTRRPPAPVLGETFNVKPVAGKVLVKGSGGTFVPLTEARQLATGAIVDARRGTLELTAATPRKGKLKTGKFKKGVFRVLQSRKRSTQGVVELRLATRFKGCSSRSVSTAAAAKPKNQVLNLLQSDAHGAFRTRGKYSAATVRGTKWDTADRCDGTLTIVHRGRVAVQDFTRRKTVLISAGEKYLARP